MRKRAIRADENLHRKLAGCRVSTLTKVFRCITCLGSLTFGSIFAALLGRTGNRTLSRKFLAGIFGSRIIAFLVKKRIKRARPGDKLVNTRTYSFPSGHTATAFAAASVLSRRTDISDNALYGMAGLVGLSRVYLGAHYLSDVAVGGMIGQIIGRASSY